MTDHELLEDPSGAPYPETVQVFARHYFPDLDVDVAQRMRQDLTDALEAAIAADRERRPAQPELDQEQLDRLTNVYAAGFGSGAATALMQGAPAELAQPIAMWLLRRFLDDPAARLELEDLARRTYTGELDKAAWRHVTAYPTQPRDYRDD